MLTTLLCRNIFTICILSLAMTACDSSYNSQTDSNSKLPITSCNADEMGKINVHILSSNQKSTICAIMVSSIHRMPPVYLLKDFERFVSLVKSTASDEDVNSIARQTMNIVRLRQQQNDNDAMQNTFDTLWRIYQNTQTHVTVGDLYQRLRERPQVAAMSDESLERFGISLWRRGG